MRLLVGSLVAGAMLGWWRARPRPRMAHTGTSPDAGRPSVCSEAPGCGPTRAGWHQCTKHAALAMAYRFPWTD